MPEKKDVNAFETRRPPPASRRSREGARRLIDRGSLSGDESAARVFGGGPGHRAAPHLASIAPLLQGARPIGYVRIPRRATSVSSRPENHNHSI